MVGMPLSALHPAQDYDEFLAHIRQTITDLEEETEPMPESPPSIPFESTRKLVNTSSGKRGRDDSNESNESRGPSRRPSRVLLTPIFPVKRSRRSTASYD